MPLPTSVVLSLDGLTTGDAFGQLFFSPQNVPTHHNISTNAAPPGPWLMTDDSEQAIVLCEILARHNRIDPDDFATTLARRFMANPNCGYGAGAKRTLTDIYSGTPWQIAAPSAFNGTGSLGNGSAMRVGPLGPFFAHDIPRLIEEAARSASVTHAHPEAHAGAIAVALAAAFAANHPAPHTPRLLRDFFDFILDHTPGSRTRDSIARAADLPRLSTPVAQAVAELGNGSRVTCPDTVPLCLWLAARHLDNYPLSLWHTVTAAGDIDTNCAIVGSITSLSSAVPIPPTWLRSRGPLRPTPSPF